LLSGLDTGALETLASSALQVRVPARGWLFRQGDAADDLAVVVSGRLEVIVDADGDLDDSGDASVARHVGPGAALGELSLLTGTERSASVRAIRDSELVVVPRPAFEQLLASDAGFAGSLARFLATDLRESRSFALPPAVPTVFTVVPLEHRAPAVDIASQLAAELRSWGSVALLDDGTARDAPSHSALLSRCEADHAYVVLVSDQGDDDPEWRAFCVRSADRIIAVAHRAPSAGWSPDARHHLAGSDLAVVEGTPASAITAWMQLLRPRARHTIAAGATIGQGAARMARRLTGRSRGLVLSGGGARGLAHLGVVGVLAEAGVEIDRVGGCSMGGFIGVMLASGWSPERMVSQCREELSRRRWFSDVRLPGSTLLTARRATDMLERVFGTTLMESLPTDVFTVSADLVSGELVVHRDGLVREAVGASMAVPGLIPPLVKDGRCLVDGGVLDNLPVDVMAEVEDGPIVAVDVMRRPTTSSHHAPGMVETMARAMVLGGWQRAERNRADAEVVVTPDVDRIGFLEFEAIDAAIIAGRRAAEAALSSLR
jgi:predicted acylesterase/phospholipase RssA